MVFKADLFSIENQYHVFLSESIPVNVQQCFLRRLKHRLYCEKWRFYRSLRDEEERA